jgi:hypothetical protein
MNNGAFPGHVNARRNAWMVVTEKNVGALLERTQGKELVEWTAYLLEVAQ